MFHKKVDTTWTVSVYRKSFKAVRMSYKLMKNIIYPYQKKQTTKDIPKSSVQKEQTFLV